MKAKMACFNLVDEPWLPVTLAEDFPGCAKRGPLPRVSLREAFEQGGKIFDLRCYAHERIALLRLLVCIAQRALNGPKNETEWQTCRSRLGRDAVKYLETHKHCFDLFGNGARFLQAHGNGKPGEMTVFRLDLIDKEGTTLFDAHVQRGRSMGVEDLAVALVKYQSFAAGGKTGGSEPSPKGRKTKSGKVKGEPQSGEAALCRDGGALHAFIVGASLNETIHWNLLCKSQIAPPMTWDRSSKPLWEHRKTAVADFPESEIKTDYLGRLAPLARAVWLGDDRVNAEIANGVRYGVFADSKDKKTKRIKPGTGIREPTASVEPGRMAEDKDRLVSASARDGVPKAAWRELHSVAILRRSGMRGGPIALEHLRTHAIQEAVLWCGALVGDQAKVGDVIESAFRLPVQLLEDADAALVEDARKCPGPNRTYRRGVELAEKLADQLQRAVFTYHLRLADDFTKKQNAKHSRKLKNQAASRFWTALEHRAEPVLLHDVALNSAKYWRRTVDWMDKSPWGREVSKAANEAYEFACPHTTPRQLRAYADGLAVLRGEERARSAPEVKGADDKGSTEGGEE